MLGIISGLTSLVSFGFTGYEISKVNNKIAHMKKVIASDHGKLVSLSSVVGFNSGQLQKLENIQIHTSEVITRIKNTVAQNVELINEMSHNVMCLSLKLTYIQMSTIIEKIMSEVQDILKGNFNVGILTDSVKNKICSNMRKEGFETYTYCENFDMVTESDQILLENKLVMFTKIPIKSTIDVFQLVKFIPLPIKYKDNFVKANLNNLNYFAVGQKYRTNIDFKHCKKLNNDLFCRSRDAYVGVKDNETCIGSIISNSENVYEKCEFNKVVMEDVFFECYGYLFL